MKINVLEGNHGALRFLAGLLLGLIILGCNAQKQKTQESAATATPKATTAASAAHAQAAESNLVQDAMFGAIDKNWKISYAGDPKIQEASVKSATLPGNEVVPCLMVRTDQSAEINMNSPVAISPDKTYRFSIWVKQDAAKVGTRFFGAYYYDENNKMIQPSKLDGQMTPPNQHFASFNYQDGNWHEVVGYLLPSSAAASAKVPADATEITVKAPANVRTTNVFFLNYYNNGTPVAVWIAKPTIQEVQPSR